jgi:2',3'-cyclic-nucleotide 2'-phosphodiesterase
MRILFIGEIVAKPGRKAVKEVLPKITKEIKPDLVIANVENLAHGRGITESTLEEIKASGVDFFTGGDHIFWNKGTENIIDNLPLIRPANYPEGIPGKGHEIIDTGKNGNVLIINLMGRTSFTNSLLDDPFRKVDSILEEHKNKDISATIVDFHAEATSEKYALGFYLDGRVDAVVGSHTHVPTCDNRVLPNGTLYVTDVGMTGNIDSVLGVKKEIVQKLYLTGLNQKFEWETYGKIAFRSVIIDTLKKTIERSDVYL